MMNKQDLQGTFSKIQTPDELLEEVCSLLSEKKVRPNTWKIVSRVAACAAVLAIVLTALLWPADNGMNENAIISEPGILKAYACELDEVDAKELEKFELDSNTPFLRAIGSPFAETSSFGLPLTFQMPGDYFDGAEVTFEVSSDYENFCPKQTLQNGESIYFKNIPHKEIWADIGIKGSFYLNVVIYADGNVVGYGIVSFCFYSAFYAYEYKTVCYPLVDGKYQDVTEEYVWQQIEQYKQSKPYGEGYAIVQQIFEDARKNRSNTEGK